MKRSEHRILTTHVGSLIRPKAVLDAAKDRDPAHGEAHETRAEASRGGRRGAASEAGIDVVNDGEFGKSGWANYSLERLSGFEPRPDKLYPAVWLGRDRIRFAEFMAAEFPRGTVGTPGHACVGPITYRATPACVAISPTSRLRPPPHRGGGVLHGGRAGERRLRRRQRALCE